VRLDLKSKFFLFLVIGMVSFLIACCLGCNYKDQYIGVYQAEESNGRASKEKIVFELKENNKGVWSRRDEEVSFSWSVNNDDLRINTRDGGTMVGKIKRKGITMIFPGEEEITFKKIR
jgi:hypothetical protein